MKVWLKDLPPYIERLQWDKDNADTSRESSEKHCTDGDLSLIIAAKREFKFVFLWRPISAMDRNCLLQEPMRTLQPQWPSVSSCRVLLLLSLPLQPT